MPTEGKEHRTFKNGVSVQLVQLPGEEKWRVEHFRHSHVRPGAGFSEVAWRDGIPAHLRFLEDMEFESSEAGFVY
jgi:hypothetical protein